MNKDVKFWAGLALVGLLAFAAYKYFHKTYDPIVFLEKKYLHVEVISQNEHVHNHIFTVKGVPISKSKEWIQITNLGPKVTKAMRDQVDQQIRSTMRVKPLPGSANRLFGTMQGVAVHVYMMESTYLIYAEEMVQGGEEEYRANAGPKFDAMEWIPADNL